MENTSIINSVLALVFVLSLIGLLSFSLQKFANAKMMNSAKGKAKKKRLGLVEILQVDSRRKLLLIQRDDAEHLVLLNGERDTVIETNIKPATNAANANAASKAKTTKKKASKDA